MDLDSHHIEPPCTTWRKRRAWNLPRLTHTVHCFLYSVTHYLSLTNLLNDQSDSYNDVYLVTVILYDSFLTMACMLVVCFLRMSEICFCVALGLDYLLTIYRSVVKSSRNSGAKPKFHYADFPVTSATNPRDVPSICLRRRPADFPVSFCDVADSPVSCRHGEVSDDANGLVADLSREFFKPSQHVTI